MQKDKRLFFAGDIAFSCSSNKMSLFQNVYHFLSCNLTISKK